jgi:hypothetical protein
MPFDILELRIRQDVKFPQNEGDVVLRRELGKGEHGSVRIALLRWRGKVFRRALKLFKPTYFNLDKYLAVEKTGAYEDAAVSVPTQLVRIDVSDYGLLMPICKQASIDDVQTAESVLKLPKMYKIRGLSNVDLKLSNLGVYKGRVLPIDPDSIVRTTTRDGYYGSYVPWKVDHPPWGDSPNDNQWAEIYDVLEEPRTQHMFTCWAAIATALSVTQKVGCGDIIWAKRKLFIQNARSQLSAASFERLSTMGDFVDQTWPLVLKRLRLASA